MNRSLVRTMIAGLAGAALLSGCDTLQPLLDPKPAPKPVSAPPTPAPRPAVQHPPAPTVSPAVIAGEQALKDGIEAYNKGTYNDAIKRLSAPEIAAGGKSTQVQAYKYIAFSYCVSGRQTLCRQAFDKAFRLDHGFDLGPGEHGHPLWGPAFAKAKKAAK